MLQQAISYRKERVDEDKMKAILFCTGKILKLRSEKEDGLLTDVGYLLLVNLSNFFATVCPSFLFLESLRLCCFTLSVGLFSYLDEGVCGEKFEDELGVTYDLRHLSSSLSFLLNTSHCLWELCDYKQLQECANHFQVFDGMSLLLDHTPKAVVALCLKN